MKKRICTNRLSFATRFRVPFLSAQFVLWLCGLLIGAALVSPMSAAPVTIKQLRSLAVEALRDGDVAYSPPWHKTSGRTLWVKDVGPIADRPGAASLDYWLAENDPVKAVFLDQLAIEIRRQRLFAGTRQQLIIEPYYRQMEEIVAAELAIVQGEGEEKQRQLDERLKQLGALLKTGVEAAARDMRLTGAFIEPGHDDGTLWLDRLFAFYAPRQGQVNYAQLQQGVAQVIRDKALVFEAPKISANASSLVVVDVGLPVESPRPLARIEEVAAEMARLDIRRRYPIPHQASRSIMESVYAQMELAIRQRLNELRQAGAASADAAKAEVAAASAKPADSAEKDGPGEEETRVDRSPFGQSLDRLLKQGLQRCAQNMGNLRLDFSDGPNFTTASAQAVRLAAPTGTKIELVYNADHKLWSLVGKSEGDYPWVERKAGDVVDLAGGYWFRLTYSDGRQLRLYKKIAVNQRELRFPDR